MKTIAHRFILIGIAALIYSSCNKSDNDKTAFQNPDRGVQIFKINARSGGSSSSGRAGPVIFPANVFVNTSNQPVVGVVDIQLQEIYSAPPFDLAETPNTNKVVASNEFYIRATATQNGLPLHILEAVTYRAALPFDTIFGE